MTARWQQQPMPMEYLDAWEQGAPGTPAPRCYQTRDGLTALVGREPVAPDDLRWHVSVRYGDRGINGRVPTWEELVAAAHELRPGIVFVVGVPPRDWWMNVHPDVLHLWELRDEHLTEQWRAEAQGHEPT